MGLSSAMLAAAGRSGVGEGLRQELSDSKPARLKRFQSQIPDMYPKAYRWVEEMRQIALLLGPEDPAHLIFEGTAALYARVANKGETIVALDGLLCRSTGPSRPNRDRSIGNRELCDG